MGYGRTPNKLYTGRLLMTGNDTLSASFEIINKVNFPNITFIPILNGFLQWDENTGEFTILKNGILFIAGTLSYNITTGNSRIEITTEKYDGSWSFLNSRSSTFPSSGANQVYMAGKIAMLKGEKIRFSTAVAVGSGDYLTYTLGNGSIVPAGIVDFSLWS